MQKYFILLFTIILWSVQSSWAQKQDFSHVPGTVVAYVPTASETYFGSPSLAILPNGDYLASHDVGGPNATDWYQAETSVYRSKNKGKSWKKISVISGMCWASLFVHKGALYLMGVDRTHGNAVIRKSLNGGKTWTQPTNRQNGVLLTEASHCAPMPVVEHNGRLWRPMETSQGPTARWPRGFGAMVMSAPVDADLLDAKSWQRSNSIPVNTNHLKGLFAGWLEGNFVVDKEGKMWNVLRVHNRRATEPETVALVSISPDGKKLSFDPETGFIPFEGGSKKFAIRYDPVSEHYWTLANPVLPKYRKQYPESRNPSSFRNVLALYKSKDMFTWERVKVVLEHEDVTKHAFQYADFLFEGDDIIYLSRTAHFDGKVDAKHFHDANFLTFHRIEGFRGL